MLSEKQAFVGTNYSKEIKRFSGVTLIDTFYNITIFKKVVHICFMLLFLIPHITFGQPDYKEVESLIKQSEECEGIEKIRLLNKISKEMYLYSPDSGIVFAKKAFQLALPMDSLYQQYVALKCLGGSYDVKIMNDSAYFYFQRRLDVALQMGDDNLIAETQRDLGYIMWKQGKFDKALIHYRDGLKYAELVNDENNIAYLANNIGVIYYQWGQYEAALQYYMRTYRIRLKQENFPYVAILGNNIGLVYKDLENDSLAWKYFNEGLQYGIDGGYDDAIAYSRVNIGQMYYKNREYEKALENFKESNRYYSRAKHETGQVLARTWLGNTYRQLKDYSKAEKIYTVLCDFAKKINDRFGLANVYYQMAINYNMMQQPLTALEYIGKSQRIARKEGFHLIRRDNRKLMAEIYAKLNKYKAAFNMQQTYITLKDSIENEQNRLAIEDLRVKLELEQKQQENEALKRNVAHSETIRNFTILILVVILILGGVVFSRYRFSVRANKKLAEKNEVIKKTNEQLEKTLTRLSETQESLIEAEKLASIARLVSGITHQLNTPVGVGITAASSLQEKTKEFEKIITAPSLKRNDLRDFLHSVSEVAELLLSTHKKTSQIINDFKLVSIDPDTDVSRNIHLVPFINNVIMSAQQKLNEKNIRTYVEGDKEIALLTKPDTIAHIFSNLLLNSLHHGFKNMHDGEIVIKIEQTDVSVVIKYSDNGLGYDQTISENIFDPFIIINDQNSSGLGLHIVYNLVTQKLAGEITTSTNEKNELTFLIKIPKQKTLEQG